VKQENEPLSQALENEQYGKREQQATSFDDDVPEG
jgi:hypothetical protein